MNRTLQFATICFSILSFSVQVQAAERPNILIIMVDDLGYSDIGCYGGEIETPHLDALANQGFRFSQFYNTAKCHYLKSFIANRTILYRSWERVVETRSYICRSACREWLFHRDDW